MATLQNTALRVVARELKRARKHGSEFVSLHEAYSVILEELDELWDIVRKKKCERSEDEIYSECIQIAAMAIKTIQSIHNCVGGDV